MATNFKLQKLIADNTGPNIFNLTVTINPGVPNILNNKTFYDEEERELFVNLDGQPANASYQVTHQIDFTPYASKYDALKTVTIEKNQPSEVIEYEVFNLNINDTTYPPPRHQIFANREIKQLIDIKYDLAHSMYSAFSGLFTVERITLTDNGAGSYIAEIEISYTPSRSFTFNSIQVLPDLHRGQLINALILRVNDVTGQIPAPPTNLIAFPPIQINKSFFKTGLSIIVTDKALTAAEWALIDTKKAIIYA